MPLNYVFDVLNQERSEIRLLHLDLVKATKSDYSPRLTGQISHVSLLDAPHYNALSYVWGNPAVTSNVFLDDGSCIPIASNLLDALLHVRAAVSVPLPIWVDAVCMNQADATEKSWQVQMMDRIYQGATSTFIYLGPSTPESDLAIRSFSIHGREALQNGILDLDSGPSPLDSFGFGYERWTLGPLDSGGKKMLDRIIHDVQDPTQMSPMILLASIMQRPWWSRIWVLQELLLSPNPILMCGNKTISARGFVASVRLYEAALTVFFETLLSRPNEHESDWTRLNRIRLETRRFHCMADVPALVLYTTQLRQFERSKYHGIEEPYFGLGNLWDLVQDITLSTRRLDASDPRDRIYALIGIARLSRVDPVTIRPDYTLTCADVYANATHLFMQYTGARMLQVAASNRQRSSIPNLPSWAVDWSQTELMAKPIPITDIPYKEIFKLVRNTDNKHVLTTSVTVYGMLETMKVIAPRIKTTSITPRDDLNTDELLSDYLLALEAYTKAHCSTLQASHNYLERLLRTFIMYPNLRNSEVGDSAFTPTQLDESIFLIQETMHRLSEMDQNTKVGSLDYAVEEGADCQLESGAAEISKTSAKDESKSSPMSKVLSFAWNSIAETVALGSRAFVANGNLIGVGPETICDGDLLVGYKREGLRFVVRVVKDGLCELIGMACVPQLDHTLTTAGYQSSDISLC